MNSSLEIKVFCNLLDISRHNTGCHKFLSRIETPHLATHNNNLLVFLENLKRGHGLSRGRGNVGTLAHQQQLTDRPVLTNSRYTYVRFKKLKFNTNLRQVWS